MADAITIKALQDASLDAKSLEEVVNGNEVKQVTTRKGETYPSVKKAIKTMFDNGGLPATPFATKALMTASALVDGKYAQVTDDTVNNGLYVKTAGAWVKSSYDPLAQSKAYSDAAIAENIYTDNRMDNVFEFADAAGAVGVSIDESANINAANIHSEDIVGVAFQIVDENGNPAVIVTSDGELQAASLNQVYDRLTLLEGGGGNQEKELTTLLKTDYMHIFSYGQSLSRGAQSVPPVSTIQPYNNVTFASGVLRKVVDVHDFTTFKPLVEELYNGEAETPTSGMLNTFVKKQVDKGDLAENWQMVGTAPGHHSYTISQLNKGTTEYVGMLGQVQAAYNIAQAQGKTYSVWAMAWTQGENDHAIDTTRKSYYDMLLKLRDDFDTDVNAITKQGFTPLVVMYQVAAHRRYSRDEMPIALAQLDAATEAANIVMACPIYQIPHNADNLHLSADSSNKLGRYYARALDYTMTNGEKWQPLKPIKTINQGKVLEITFNKSGLVFDTTEVTLTHNKGFDVWSNGTLLDTITSVEIIDSNRVKIKLSNPLPVGAKLSYAKGRVGDPITGGPITGARGNLRDKAGDDDFYNDSLNRVLYLHNWCVMFEIDI